MNRLCIFEDDKYPSLYPLVYNRPVYDLNCGMFSLIDRIKNYYPEIGVELFCREYLADVFRESSRFIINEIKTNSDSYLFINGRILMQKPIPLEGDEEIGVQGDTIVYARLKKSNYTKVNSSLFYKGDIREFFGNSIKVVETDAVFIEYFWDLLKRNNSQLETDFKDHVKKGSIEGKLYDGVYLIDEDNIFVGDGSKIKPGCVLDAENGPIYIGRNVTVASNSTIEGPVYIGDDSKINAHSRILEGSNIRRSCRMGGEVKNSIIQDFSNKQHDGFLGHAYLGSWVNLGADTVNSNLKNTYESISIKLNKKTLNTEQMFLGVAIGDHSKSAINTTFMTGSIIGFGCNVVTSKYPPKFVPSFTWCIDKGIVPQGLESVISTAETVMERRNKTLSESEKVMYKAIYDLTEIERTKY